MVNKDLMAMLLSANTTANHMPPTQCIDLRVRKGLTEYQYLKNGWPVSIMYFFLQKRDKSQTSVHYFFFTLFLLSFWINKQSKLFIIKQ